MEHASEETLDSYVAHHAAATGKPQVLTQAIKEDPSVLEQQDQEGLTPLSHAVTSEHLESVKLLVKMGANINAQDNLGRTCLSMAAYQGWYNGVVFLLRNGAKQRIPDKAGRTPLHSATYCTDTSTLNVLLQNITEEDLHVQDHEGMTALHWSCFHDRPEHTQTLLQKGLDPSIQDIDGRTALHWAAQNGNTLCCALLADDNAVLLNEADFSGKRAIHFAAAAGHEDVVRELAIVQRADAQAEDNDDRTPLHWAAATGQVQTLKTLLDLNVNPNPMDIDDGTPLDYARQSGHTECVRILEHKLGLNPSTAECINKSTSSTENQKSKRNPFGFIADLFRSKKNDKSVETNTGVSRRNIKFSKAEQSNTNTSNQEYPSSPGSQCRGERSSDQLDLSPQLTNNSPALSRGSFSSDTRLSTPKKQRESEVLRSIEMIHLSREDNPAVQKLRHSEHVLTAIQTPQNIPKWDTGKAVLPPMQGSDTSRSSSPIPYNVLVRSPPPVIKHAHSHSSRDSSLSPVPTGKAMFSPRQEYTREQIEHDAAEILALHKATGQLTDRSTPRSQFLDEISPRSLLSDDSSGSSPVLKPKGGKIKLAPLKGPVPNLQPDTSSPGPVSPLAAPLNRNIAQLRRESHDVSGKRPPTPPSWDTQRQNSNLKTQEKSESSRDASPHLSKRKKKRKTDLSRGDRSNQQKQCADSYNDKNMESRDILTPASENRMTEKQQVSLGGGERENLLTQRKAMDKSIKNLLN